LVEEVSIITAPKKVPTFKLVKEEEEEIEVPTPAPSKTSLK
jgi:hypothetical protein